MEIFFLIGFLIVFQAGQCKHDQSHAANCSSCRYVSEGDEEALKHSVGTTGPIYLTIDAICLSTVV